jgi:hypothetical protein
MDGDKRRALTSVEKCQRVAGGIVRGSRKSTERIHQPLGAQQSPCDEPDFTAFTGGKARAAVTIRGIDLLHGHGATWAAGLWQAVQRASPACRGPGLLCVGFENTLGRRLWRCRLKIEQKNAAPHRRWESCKGGNGVRTLESNLHDAFIVLGKGDRQQQFLNG